MAVFAAVLPLLWSVVSTPVRAEACEVDKDSLSFLQFRAELIKNAPYKESTSSEDYAKGFHCHEALDEWRRGWSQLKMKWCCEKLGIACNLLDEGEHAPETGGVVMEPDLELTNTIDIVIEVDTSSATEANTSSGASMAFEIGTHWTEELELCKEASSEEVIARMIRLPSWPTRLRVRALGNDSWGYTAIYFFFTDSKNGTVRIPVLNNTQTIQPYEVGSTYWLDGAGGALSEQIYLVPELPADSELHTQCTTKDDPRAHRLLYETSPVGTPCVFGVDDADEGSHCIYDDGKYGSFGWCYTSADKNSWGSCNEDCPLYGQFRVLGAKVDEILRRLKRMNVAATPLATTSAKEIGTEPATPFATTSAKEIATEPNMSTSSNHEANATTATTNVTSLIAP
eukprot:TRINITY_DN3632_c0_g1_i1.p1 TRINITY_DN3632_c0_g1~~TRINITY_DN3632_c0_g1_i1.p1  ORF type:complete len:398 (-),score=57.28 TRINITY_DN3632_c0_g1_i1:52-1245(-)